MCEAKYITPIEIVFGIVLCWGNLGKLAILDKVIKDIDRKSWDNWDQRWN